jgi:tetratricopeptide (TPR) repeat protein
MAKLCPSCGATTVAEARFCRVCGTLLTRPGKPTTDDRPVSPGAKTVPLSNESRPTKGIGADEPHGPVTNTSKVRRAEMDDLLRRPPAERDSASGADGSKSAPGEIHISAPPTNELTPPETLAGATPSPVASPASRTGPKGRARRTWPIILGLLVAATLLIGLILLLSSRRRGEPASSNTSSAPQPSPVNDQSRLVDEQLAEAETLLAAGQTSEAIARLRTAIELDPTNAEAHRRLGEALEKSGERQAAIEEYRVATLNDQNNAEAWRELASAQLAEGLFNDAVESYRRFITLKGEAEVDDNTRLDYAQALLLAGRTDEARAIYQRVASSGSQDLAARAKRQLAQLPLLPSANANNAQTPRADQTQNNNTAQPTPPQPTPSTAPTPAPTVQPTPVPTPTPQANDNAAQIDPDTYYQRGLSIVSGRDIKSLPRAELLQALEYFQRAQNGPHRAEATRYVQQLGREYDRRKKQP